MTREPEHLRSGPAPQAMANPTSQNRTMWLGGGLLAAVTFGIGAFLYTGHGVTGTNGIEGTSPAALQNTPASDTGKPDAAARSLTAAVQLPMLPPSAAPRTLARTAFSPDQQEKILAAIQRGDMRLVEMPVLDATGKSGQIVDLTTAGMTQRVVLTGRFQPLVLPISVAGEVVVTPVTKPAAPALTIGAMTALGPQILPSLTALDQRIVLNVIVQ